MTGRTALLGAGVVALFLAHALYLAGVAEDAFISFRFARNLVEGYGLVWNPGEAPVEGFTNFLWVLSSAAWIASGVDPVRGAQLLGVAACLATLFVTWKAGLRGLGWSPERALLPCVFLALSGPFAAWATGGLETSAFGMLLAVAVYRFSLYWGEARARDLTAAFLALVLSALTRPEGLLAFAVICALGLALASGRPEARRQLLARAGLGAGLLALFFAWRWSYFGDLLPNTFYAKTGDAAAQVKRGAAYVGWFALHYLLPWLPALVLGWLGRRAGVGAALRAKPVLLTSATLAAACGAAVVWEGGDYMAMYRFLAPLLPMLYLLLAAAAGPLLPRSAGPRRVAGLAALGCAALGTLFHSTPLEAALPSPPRMHGNWRGVQTERWHVARLSEIGRFFASEARPGESVATDAIGAIGWYSRLPVYGAHGLVDPVLARRQAARIGAGVAGHERMDFAYLMGRRPTFLMFRRDLRSEPLQHLRFNADVDEELAREYELRSVWLEDPVNGEAGWFPFLERRDRGRNGV